MVDLINQTTAHEAIIERKRKRKQTGNDDLINQTEETFRSNIRKVKQQKSLGMNYGENSQRLDENTLHEIFKS